MSTDGACRVVLSNLGWVDDGALWSYDADNRHAARVPLSGARALELAGGSGDTFAVVHHFNDPRLVDHRPPLPRPGHRRRSSLVDGAVALDGDHAA